MPVPVYHNDPFNKEDNRMKKRKWIAAVALIAIISSMSLCACAEEPRDEAIAQSTVRQTRLAARDEKIALAAQTKADREAARILKTEQAEQRRTARVAARDEKIALAAQKRAARLTARDERIAQAAQNKRTQPDTQTEGS